MKFSQAAALIVLLSLSIGAQAAPPATSRAAACIFDDELQSLTAHAVVAPKPQSDHRVQLECVALRHRMVFTLQQQNGKWLASSTRANGSDPPATISSATWKRAQVVTPPRRRPNTPPKTPCPPPRFCDNIPHNRLRPGAGVDFSSYDGTYYRDIGDFLREAYLELPFTAGTHREVDFLEKELALPAGALLLDIGCGPGRHSLELARRGYHTTGIDISAGFIDVADVCAKHDNLPATFRVADARDLPFPSSPLFDAAICLCQGAFGLVGAEDSHRLVLREVHRVLKPASLFILTAVHSYAASRHPGFDPQTALLVEELTLRNAAGDERSTILTTTTFTARELTLLLEVAGFSVEDIYGCNPGHYARRAITVDDWEIMAIARRM